MPTISAYDPLRIALNDALNEVSLTEVLEALAAEVAVRKRDADLEDKPRWDRGRSMILKAAAVTRDLQL